MSAIEICSSLGVEKLFLEWRDCSNQLKQLLNIDHLHNVYNRLWSGFLISISHLLILWCDAVFCMQVTDGQAVFIISLGIGLRRLQNICRCCVMASRPEWPRGQEFGPGLHLGLDFEHLASFDITDRCSQTLIIYTVSQKNKTPNTTP